jgi:ketopantoate reductase
MNYTIIGAGRIGTALASMERSSVLIRRGEKIPDSTGPIIVCTRNDDLNTVMSTIPLHRKKDLVFVQNGMLQSWLIDNDVADCTQALLYFAVSKKGESPVDGGGSVVKGPFSTAFVSLLSKGRIDCTEVDGNTFSKQMAEKFLWNCVFGVLCQYFDVNVGVLCTTFHKETIDLIYELEQVIEKELCISFDAGINQRLINYSLSISEYQGAVKEWRWRNGWLWERQQTPLHKKYLGEDWMTI